MLYTVMHDALENGYINVVTCKGRAWGFTDISTLCHRHCMYLSVKLLAAVLLFIKYYPTKAILQGFCWGIAYVASYLR